MRTREIALGGLLTALALIIPFAFRGTPLQLFIPAFQYSATFASHVPSMLSIVVSPLAAAMVDLSSTIGSRSLSIPSSARARLRTRSGASWAR